MKKYMLSLRNGIHFENSTLFKEKEMNMVRGNIKKMGFNNPVIFLYFL